MSESSALQCPCATGPAAAACYAKLLPRSACAHERTDAASVRVLGLHCTRGAAAERGLVLASLTNNGATLVCTGGDHYYAMAQASDDAAHFAALSTPMAPMEQPALYWLNLSASAAAAATGARSYQLAVSLVETQQRALQHAEGRGPLAWSAEGGESPLDDYLRLRSCAWQPVPAAAALRLETAAELGAAGPEPQCRAVGGQVPMAYVALGPDGCGGGLCTGEAVGRLLNTSNENRLAQRTRKGFRHVLKPLGCRYHLYGEAELTACLRGRAVLNMGSSLATDLAKGLARINTSLQAWTRRRPGSTAEQRKSLTRGERLPQVADFHYQFERTGGFWHDDVMVGVSAFGAARVTTMLTDHPPHYGLLNVLDPPAVRAAERSRVGFASARRYEQLICRHDLVVLESGAHDFGLPFSDELGARHSRLHPACGAQPAAACAAALRPALKNQSWRLRPLAAYRERLRALLDIWRRCRAARPGFRALFKLAPAPRARQGARGGGKGGGGKGGGGKGGGRARRRGRRGRHLLAKRAAVDDCEAGQYGYSTQAHHVAVFNEVARAAVTAAGFEAFDPFGATLHAQPHWYDDMRVLGHSVFEAEALSDTVTQMLLNQICTE